MSEPERASENIELDIESKIFELESEKAFSSYEESANKYLFNEDNLKNKEKNNLTYAVNVDDEIKKWKKEKNKKKGLTFQNLSFLVSFSFIYFSCKGLIGYFRKNENNGVESSTPTVSS